MYNESLVGVATDEMVVYRTLFDGLNQAQQYRYGLGHVIVIGQSMANSWTLHHRHFCYRNGLLQDALVLLTLSQFIQNLGYRVCLQ